MKRPSAHVLTNVRLSPATLKSLKYRAIEERRPAAALVREAVEAYLLRPPATPKREDAVAWLRSLTRLPGADKGSPADLAFNHDHYVYGAARKKRPNAPRG